MSKSHEKIIDAAFEILANDPSAPLESIANAADVSRMTIHRLFNTRETLIEAVFNEFTKWGHYLVDEAISTHRNPIDQLEFVVKNGASNGIRFHLLFQIREHAKLQVENDKLRASAESLVVKLKVILTALIDNSTIKPHMSNAWLFYLFTAIMKCAWKAMNDGVVAPRDVPDLAWESFIEGVFASKD